MTNDPFTMSGHEQDRALAARSSEPPLASGITSSISNAYSHNARESVDALTRREQGLAEQYDPVKDARIQRIEDVYGDTMPPHLRMEVGYLKEIRAAARKSGTYIEPASATDNARTAVDVAQANRDAVYARPASTPQERTDAELALHDANAALGRITA